MMTAEQWPGDCGDVAAALWPTVIAPRVIREGCDIALDMIGSALGVDLSAFSHMLDGAYSTDPAAYTAKATA